MELVSMQLATDCGPVAMANHVGLPSVYDHIMTHLDFPGTGGLMDDFWDSPSRHFDVLEAIFGERPQLVPNDADVPKVTLIRIGWTTWHWVTYRGNNMWHDGWKLWVGGPEGILYRFSNSRMVLSYSLKGTGGDLPWYWSIWKAFTDVALLFS